MMKSLKPIMHLILISAIVPGAACSATDLWTVVDNALTHDSSMQVALAEHAAGMTLNDQADSLWRPNVQVVGAIGAINLDSETHGAQFSAPAFGVQSGANFLTSINSGITNRWAVSARQPLYSGELTKQSEQLRLGAEQSEIALAIEKQNLMMTSAEKYFALALYGEQKRVLERQRVSAKRAQEEAAERFKIGESPVTESREAEARLEAIVAQLIELDHLERLMQSEIADLTGLKERDILALAPKAARLIMPELSMEQSINEALDNNPNLLLQRKKIEDAQKTQERLASGASASVDLIAEVSGSHSTGSGDYGTSSLTNRQGVVGVQVTIPLYTGGLRENKELEAIHRREAAQAQSEKLRVEISQRLRSAWFGMTSDLKRLDALQAALRAGELRLDATRLGHSVGEKTTLDILNAENELAQVELQIIQTRIDWVINRLRLHRLTGSLGETDIRFINTLLQ